MLLRAIRRKNKRGLSLVISYVLLIAVSITVSILVYQFLKTYVPKDTVVCADGTSLLVNDISCSSSVLSVTVINNGRFGINGYYIHVSTSPSQQLATTDLSGKITSGGQSFGNSVQFSNTENSLSPGDTKISTFNVANMGMNFYTVEITPTRQEVIDNVKRFATCSDAKTTWKDTVTCA